MFDWIKKNLFGSQPKVDPYDQCVIEFLEECKRQDCVPASYDHQARRVQFADRDGGFADFQLGNLFATWLPLDQRRRTEVVARFVRSIVESRKHTPISPETFPDQLMPAIRARALIGSAFIQNLIAGALANETTEIAWLPFAGDIVACVVRDMTDSMVPMTRANLSFADIPIDVAMSKAMANFRVRMPAPSFEPVGDGVFGCANFEDHQSALLLLQPGSDYALPPIDGTPVALVPNRNTFYLTGSANMPGLTGLLDRSETAGQLPHFCSSTILQWTGYRWSEFHFDPGTANADRQRRIALGGSMNDYGFQKQLLDKYHHTQGLDIFVASVMAFQKQDQSIMTVASLGSGTAGTLLPHAERLSFVKQIVDPRTGLAEQKAQDSVVVAWSEAMAIVGHLFEPVANLYPPRLRALGFPDDAAWAKLKALDRLG